MENEIGQDSPESAAACKTSRSAPFFFCFTATRYWTLSGAAFSSLSLVASFPSFPEISGPSLPPAPLPVSVCLPEWACVGQRSCPCPVPIVWLSLVNVLQVIFWHKGSSKKTTMKDTMDN